MGLSASSRIGEPGEPSYVISALATLAVAAPSICFVAGFLFIGPLRPLTLLLFGAAVCLTICAKSFAARVWASRLGAEGVPFDEVLLWARLRRCRAERAIENALAAMGVDRGGWPRAEEPPPLAQLTQGLKALPRALDRKSVYTLGHSGRVEGLALAIGSRLRLGRDARTSLALAATLHDVPSFLVPDASINTGAALGPRERVLLQARFALGGRLVEIAAPPDVSNAVVHHRERWDGSGYPHGLRGTDIPLAGRIIAVAEAYDAMVSGRPHRPALSKKDALATLVAASGSQFDGRVVQACTDVIRRPSFALQFSFAWAGITEWAGDTFAVLKRFGAVLVALMVLAFAAGSISSRPEAADFPAAAARVHKPAKDKVLGERTQISSRNSLRNDDLESRVGRTLRPRVASTDSTGSVAGTSEVVTLASGSDSSTSSGSSPTFSGGGSDNGGGFNDVGGTTPGTGGSTILPPPDIGEPIEQPPLTENGGTGPSDSSGGSSQLPVDPGSPSPADNGAETTTPPPDGGTSSSEPTPSDSGKDKNPNANGNGHAYGHGKDGSASSL